LLTKRISLKRYKGTSQGRRSEIVDKAGLPALHRRQGNPLKLITNDRVVTHSLGVQYQPELFVEFQKNAEMTSTLQSEAEGVGYIPSVLLYRQRVGPQPYDAIAGTAFQIDFEKNPQALKD
jgi:hypothetical protein